MKSVLFFISNLRGGGAQRVVSELANELCRKGIKTSIAMLYSGDMYYAIDNDIDTYVFSRSDNKTINQFKRLRFIENTVKQVKPECVISFLAEINIYVSMALWNTNVPLIVSERNDPSKEPDSRLKKIIRKIAYLRPNGFVFQTKQAQAYFNERIQSRSIIIHNPIKNDLPEADEQYDPHKIVSIGRLEKQKNYFMAFSVISELKSNGIEAEYFIYGDGNQREQLEKQIHELGLENNIKLMGTSKNVHNYIKDANIFILVSDYEGLPNVLMEAMAMGLVCISTNCPCGGPAELIQDGVNGYLVGVNDISGMFSRVSNVISNSRNFDEMRLKAKKIRLSHSLNIIVEEWITYIDEVLRNDSGINL